MNLVCSLSAVLLVATFAEAYIIPGSQNGEFEHVLFSTNVASYKLREPTTSPMFLVVFLKDH